jgi:histone deacetylase complex subunit SAP18
VLTTLRVAASSPELRHPLARYSFRAIYADSANRGRFSSKDLGIVYSRDILGEPGSLQQPAPRLVTDDGPEGLFEKGRDERTLDELRFVPGDYLCVAVLLPKNITVPTGTTGELAIKGTAAPVGAAPGGWKNAGGSGGRADAGWGGALGAARGTGRGGGGHWRGGSDAPPARSVRGGAGRGGVAPDIGRRDRDHDVYQPRDDDRGDRRIPPPRRALTPPRRGRGRGGRSRSRSRSPPPRRDRRD